MFLQLVSFDHFRRLRQSLLLLSCRDVHKCQQPHPTTSRLLDGSMLLAPTAYLWGGNSHPSSTSILPSATHLFSQGAWMLGASWAAGTCQCCKLHKVVPEQGEDWTSWSPLLAYNKRSVLLQRFKAVQPHRAQWTLFALLLFFIHLCGKSALSFALLACRHILRISLHKQANSPFLP